MRAPPIFGFLPVLVLTPSLTADNFVWNPHGPDQTLWSDHLNWDGPAGGVPNGNNDTARVNGNGPWDPIVDRNYVIGALTIEAIGHVRTGDGTWNSLLSVTNTGGHSGNTLITGTGSTLTVYRSKNMNDFDTEDLTLSLGGLLKLRDGAKVQIDDFLDINEGSQIDGAGSIELSGDSGSTNPQNDGRIFAWGGTMRIFGDANVTFDLDGVGEDGALVASNNATLIIDTEVESAFDGTMTLGTRSRIEINDSWRLERSRESIIFFNGGTGDNTARLAGSGVTFQGDININSGVAAIDASASFGSQVRVNFASGTTLQIENVCTFFGGAQFLGAGNVRVRDGGTLWLWNGASIPVPMQIDGQTMIASGPGTATASTVTFGPTGRCNLEFRGETPGTEFDRLNVTGTITLDGRLDLARLDQYLPAEDTEFTIITAGNVTGQFAQVTGWPNAEIVYGATSVTVIAPIPCPADVTNDGDIDFDDLLLVLAAWGQCPDCPEDFDGNGGVDFDDLLTVLAAWGPCPS